MADEKLICALPGCDRIFEPKVHNQRFCGKECCRIHTNKKILEQYHAKKNRSLKDRRCAEKGCDTILSIYNEDKYCGAHQQKAFMKKLKSWGWKVPDTDFDLGY